MQVCPALVRSAVSDILEKVQVSSGTQISIASFHRHDQTMSITIEGIDRLNTHLQELSYFRSHSGGYPLPESTQNMYDGVSTTHLYGLLTYQCDISFT